MSLVSLHWGREYNTTGKAPDNWHNIFMNPLVGYVPLVMAISNFFSPEYIEENIKHMFLFPNPRRQKKKPHLYLIESTYYGSRDILFV